MIESQKKSSHSAFSIFVIFLKLGLTSFGGPVAHIGFFRDEFVSRRGWLTDKTYGDLVALCQFLPGPASSQVGLALGFMKNRFAGALAAWLGFTLPSALLLVLFALSLQYYDDLFNDGVLQGLKLVAIAVVIQALFGMGRSFITDTARFLVMLGATAVLVFFPLFFAGSYLAFLQVGVIVLAGLIGLLIFRANEPLAEDEIAVPLSSRAGLIFLALFFILLFGLPLASAFVPSFGLTLFDAFYRTGSLVFGGGHVVLPLLQAEMVPTGYVERDIFIAGYGATQAVPGPLFTFSAFLGASLTHSIAFWLGALICLVGIFLPSFLLVIGSLPFWQSFRSSAWAQGVLAGVNAAVVGLLLAALYNPLWTSTIFAWQDLLFAAMALLALTWMRLPPWLVVILGGVFGGVLSFLI